MPKPASPRTPIRNTLSLLALLAALALLISMLPTQPAVPSAARMASGKQEKRYGIPEDAPLRISEVMLHNIQAYPDETGAYCPWIEIENYGDNPLSIGGFGLSNERDRVLFTFPEIQLPPHGYVIVFCDATERAGGDGALHARFRVPESGQTVYLFDRAGLPMQSLAVPETPANMSYAFTPGSYIITDAYTPGYPNTLDGNDRMRADLKNLALGLAINELMPTNREGITDEDGDCSGWIELYNSSATPIDLHNFALSQNAGLPVAWRFPEGARIEANSYYLVFASHKDRPGGGELRPHTNFELKAEGGTLYLSDILGRTLDSTTYDHPGKDVSWGRSTDGSNRFQAFTKPSPGRAN